MTNADSSSPDPIDDAIAAWIECHERGEVPELEAFLQRYPGVKDELRRFIHDYEALRRCADMPPQKIENSPPELNPTLLSPALERLPAANLPQVHYFGDYLLLREIARGGMGIVYEARQKSLNRPVALKMILAGKLARGDEVARFRREAEAAARLEHPGIVPIYEIGQHGDQHYFTMGYVSGPSLSNRLMERPLEPREAALLMRDVALAVQYAHDKGVVHRDLKPSNILLSPRVDATPAELPFVPRITDFGLAKLTRTDDSLTETGQILGTPSYMPPEQAAGHVHAIGPAADVYALGAVLYACLTGRPPFQSASAIDTVRQVLEQDPVSLRSLNAAIPLDLETICLRCLEKSIPRRYPSARAVADELQCFLDGRPIKARPVSRRERVARWCRRNPIVAGLTAAVALSLILGTVLSTYFWWKERDRAESEAFAKSEAQAKTLVATKATDKVTEALKEQQRLTGVADSARQEEQVQRTLAVERASALRKSLYLTDMNRMPELAQAGDIGAMQTLLSRHIPVSKDDADHRGFEWHYWWGMLHREERVLKTAGPVVCLAWSTDGQTLASASHGGRLQLWNMQTGEQDGDELTWPVAGAEIAAIQFQPGNKDLLIGDADGSIQILNRATRRFTYVIASEVMGGIRRPVAFSHDGQTALSATSGELSMSLRPLNHAATVQQSPPSFEQIHEPTLGKLPGLASGDLLYLGDGVFSLTMGQRIVFSQQRTLRYEPNFGDYDPTMPRTASRVWDVSDPTSPSREEWGLPVFGIQFAPDDSQLAAGRRDGTVDVWNVNPISRRVRKPLHSGVVWSVSYHTSGDELATGGADGNVHLCDPRTLERRCSFRRNGSAVRSVDFIGPTRSLAAASTDGRVSVWNTQHETLEHEFLGHVGPALCTRGNPAGSMLASGGQDGTIRIWNLAATPSEIRVTRSVSDRSTSFWYLVAIPNSQRVHALFSFGPVQSWNLPRVVSQPADPVDEMCISSTGRTMAVVRRSTEIKVETTQRSTGPVASGMSTTLPKTQIEIWSVPSERKVASIPLSGRLSRSTGFGGAKPEDVQRVMFQWPIRISADDSMIALVMPEGQIGIYDATSGTEMMTVACPSLIDWIAWSPDGSRLNAIRLEHDPTAPPRQNRFDRSSQKSTWCVLDRAKGTWTDVAEIPQFTFAALSPDGRTAAIQSSDGRVELRSTDDGRVVKVLAKPLFGQVAFHPSRHQLYGLVTSAGANREARAYIYDCDADAMAREEPVRELTSSLMAQFPVVTADGKMVVALRTMEGPSIRIAVWTPGQATIDWLQSPSGPVASVSPYFDDESLIVSATLPTREDRAFGRPAETEHAVLLYSLETGQVQQQFPTVASGGIVPLKQSRVIATRGHYLMPDGRNPATWGAAPPPERPSRGQFGTGTRPRPPRPTPDEIGIPAAARDRNDAVTCVATNESSRRVARGTSRGRISLWNADQPAATLEKEFDTGLLTVRDIALTADGGQLYVAAEDQLLTASCTTGQFQSLLKHSAAMTAVAVNRGGTLVAGGTGDGAVYLGSVGGDLRPIKAHSQAVTAIRFSPDGHSVVTSSVDGTIRFWDIQSGELRWDVRPAGGAVLSLAFGNQGKWLAAGMASGRVEFWTVSTSSPNPADPSSPEMTGSAKPAVVIADADRRVAEILHALPVATHRPLVTVMSNGQETRVHRDIELPRGSIKITEFDVSAADEIADEFWQRLPELTELRSANIRRSKLSANQLAGVGKLKTLNQLQLEDCQIADGDIRPLKGLDRLTHLRLKGESSLVDRWVAEALSNMAALMSFESPGTNLGEQTARVLATLPQLDSLQCAQSQITDQGFQELMKSTSLRIVRLRGDLLTDDAVPNSLPKSLAFLEIPGAKLSAVTVERLARLPALRQLNLSGDTLFDDAAARALRESNSLTWTKLADTPLTDKGLLALAKEKAEPPDSDSGRPRQAPPSIDVRGTGVTSEGIVEFLEKSPQTRVFIGETLPDNPPPDLIAALHVASAIGDVRLTDPATGTLVPVTSAVLRNIQQGVRIRELKVLLTDDTEVQSLSFLKGLMELESASITLRTFRRVDVDFSGLLGTPRLQRLSIRGGDVSKLPEVLSGLPEFVDIRLSEVSNLDLAKWSQSAVWQRLKSIQLELETDFEGAPLPDLSVFAKAEELQWLEISGALLTNADLTPLKDHPALKRLRLNSRQVTPEATIRRLREQIPGVEFGRPPGSSPVRSRQPRQTVQSDQLKRLDLKTHVKSGDWQITDGVLSCADTGGVITLPDQATGYYSLKLVVEPAGDPVGITVQFPYADAAYVAAIDTTVNDTPASTLDRLRQDVTPKPSAVVVPGQVLRVGSRFTIVCQVRPDSIVVSCGDKPQLQWNRELLRDITDPAQGMIAAGTVYLSSRGALRLHSAELIPSAE